MDFSSGHYQQIISSNLLKQRVSKKIEIIVHKSAGRDYTMRGCWESFISH